ncbi:MAG: thioredoxin family protein, partial [Verrucomicrobiae bacterium]|nr:thioredoxin family protein [Verrucomicrobiae bacterium]
MTKTSKIILIGAALAVAVIGAALVKRGRQTNEPETSIPPPITARSATTGDAPAIEAVSSSPDAVARKLPKLIDLGADKCIPCKMMAPILEELKKQYAGQLEVEFIDVWKNPGAARTYGVQMLSLIHISEPT